MTIIADTVGALTIGTVLQVWIYGLVTYQYISYILSEGTDALWIRTPMTLLYGLNTVHVALSISLVWHYCIINYGRIEALFLERIPWTMVAAFLAIPLSAFIAQVFLSFRAFRILTSTRWKYTIVVYLMLLAVMGCVCGMVLGIKLYLLPNGLRDWGYLRPWVTSWLVLEVITDSSIAVTLFVALGKSTQAFRGSKRVMKRLLRTAIQTGAIASFFSIITLIVYLCLPNTFLAKITAIPIGCIYFASVMETLLSRASLRDMMMDVELGSFESSRRPQRGSNFRTTASAGSQGISVELGAAINNIKGAQEWSDSKLRP